MVFIFFAEIFILFFLSKSLTSHLSYFFHRVFRSQKITVILMAVVFLPGTIIHEFAHAIMAKALFVYVGKMELIPSVQGETLKLGSVEVGKSDIIRNFFIGIAPFLAGTCLLLIALYAAFVNKIFGFNLFTIFVLYLIFVIANTMYSSKKDMEGAVEFFLLVIAPILILYFLGVRIPGLSFKILEQSNLQEFFKLASIYMGIPLLLNIAVIAFVRLVTRR